MLFIGIDLGTSAVKMLLVDEKGQILNTIFREYPLCFPHPGWSEQDPDDWWHGCLTGIPELLYGFDAKQVGGIGCGGQMHGLVALDEEDSVIRPAILWNDGRTGEETVYLNETVGKDNRTFKPFKPNSDPLYTLSLDFSTLCRKRLLQQALQEMIEKKYKTVMAKAERVAMRNALQELQKDL